jgi:hypothetical protein
LHPMSYLLRTLCSSLPLVLALGCPASGSTRGVDGGKSMNPSSEAGPAPGDGDGHTPRDGGHTSHGGDGDHGSHGDGDTSTPGDGDAAHDAGTVTPSDHCGYKNLGSVLEVTSDIVLCLPESTCLPETCPPGLGECVDGKCVFKGAYKGLKTMPEAWVTQYCDLSTGGCSGVSQLEPPPTTADKLASDKNLPLCMSASAGEKCVGIVASPPMMIGNSEIAKDPKTGKALALWGLGLTEASGLCYELTGPGGSALVAVTDRCGGYCKCGGGAYNECGACVDADDMQVKCPCVGAAPPLYDACCVRGEPILCGPKPADDPLAFCDWCASNNHPHFDLDDATFNHICGSEKDKGSCKLSKAKFVKCREPDPAWPANR